MNAIAPSRPDTQATERTERHLRVCQRLIDLGMQLAEAAASQALAELAQPAPVAAEPEAPAQILPRCATGAGLLFVRLSRAVRQAVALEARIAAGTLAAPRCIFRPADPRRTLLQQTFRTASAGHPDRAALLREIDERLDCELALDADGNLPVAEILARIAGDLGIDLDLAKLPDELLGVCAPHWPCPASQPEQVPWMPPFRPRGAGPPALPS